ISSSNPYAPHSMYVYVHLAYGARIFLELHQSAKCSTNKVEQTKIIKVVIWAEGFPRPDQMFTCESDPSGLQGPCDFGQPFPRHRGCGCPCRTFGPSGTCRI